jgi:hypothetical protein
MRIHAALILFLVFGTFANDRPSAAAQGNQTLTLVRTATNVASHIQSGSIDGDTAIYVDPVAWMEAMTDTGLGPFLATQDAMPTRSAVCLFSKKKDRAVCVYFDGTQAYGATAVMSDPEHPFDVASVAASYRTITPDMLRKATRRINFTPRTMNLEDGQQLATFSITLGGKSAHY